MNGQLKNKMMNAFFPDAHVIANLVLDGKEYEIENFNTVFSQPYDYKGQPEHETRGGQVTVVLSNIADNNLYNWAKNSVLLKDGQIFFTTDLGIRVLTIVFTKAYCISLTRFANASSGTRTSLIFSPESISFNGVEHNNKWK